MDRKKVLEELYDQYTKKEEQIMPRQTEKKETPFWPWILVAAGAIGLVGFAAAPEDFGNLFLILVYRLLTTAGLIGACMLIIPLFEQKSAKKQVNHMKSELWLKALGELLREDLGDYRAVSFEYKSGLYGNGIAWNHPDGDIMILRAKEYTGSGEDLSLDFDGVAICTRQPLQIAGVEKAKIETVRESLEKEWARSSETQASWKLTLAWRDICNRIWDRDSRWYTIGFDKWKPEDLDVDHFDVWYENCKKAAETVEWFLGKYHETAEEA